jgi:hypothetical protein
MVSISISGSLLPRKNSEEWLSAAIALARYGQSGSWFIFISLSGFDGWLAPTPDQD